MWAGCTSGPQRNVVAAIVPGVGYARQQVFDEKFSLWGMSRALEVEVDPACLLLPPVQVDGDQNRVLLALRRTADFE